MCNQKCGAQNSFSQDPKKKNKTYTVESHSRHEMRKTTSRAARNQQACRQAILHSGLRFHPLGQDLHLFYVSFILATRGTN